MVHGAQDILRSVFSWRIWGSIALDDVVGRYRRTILGPVWLVLGQFAFIIGVYFLHRSLMGGAQQNYLTYLAASLALWGLIAGFITDGAQALVRSKGFVEAYPLPMGVYVMRSAAGGFITFAHMITAFFAISLVMRDPLEITILAWIPALALYLVFGVGAGLLLAPLSARYRDLGPALTAAMSLLFVLTPVFWAPNDIQEASPFLQLNPFYHMLEVGRAPLLGEWGDRSQITTMALASTHRVGIVAIGTSLAHMACIMLAVMAGAIFATRISPRHLTIGGAMIFLVFGLMAVYDAIYESEPSAPLHL